MLVTFEVLKLLKSIVVSFEQYLNKAAIEVTFEVLKLLIYKFVRLEHP